MPFFKVSYKYRHADAAWTENFYQHADDIVEFESPLEEEFVRLLDWRGRGVTLVSKYVLEEGGSGLSFELPINRTQDKRTGATISKDVSGVCALMKRNFDGGGTSILSVGGLADSDIIPNQNGPSRPSAFLRRGLETYEGVAIEPGHQMAGKRRIPISTAGYEWHNVVSFAPDPSNEAWTLVTIQDEGESLEVGDTVYFKGMDKLQIPWIEGDYRIVGDVTSTTFSIPTKYREQSDVTKVRNVRWRRAGYYYPPITSMRYLRMGTRKRRGPFGQRRGARSARKIRL